MAGGAAGDPGATAGGLGTGGNGRPFGTVAGGGGGGSGLFGGGGGNIVCGGGGGSSKGPAGAAFENGVRPGHGQIQITFQF